MKPVILMTGHTMPELSAHKGDFDHWFARLFGWPPSRFHVVDAIGGSPLPDPSGVDGLVISGSACSVMDRPEWSVRSGEWVKAVIENQIPVLGVCYGHQLIADVLGGCVGLNPAGREIGVCDVTQMGDDPIFEGLPKEFAVIQTHVDMVIARPPTAREIAGNGMGANQAMAIGDHVRTVQWHPEFDAEVIRHYIRVRSDLIDAEMGAGAAQDIEAKVKDVKSGQIIARNFINHFLRA